MNVNLMQLQALAKAAAGKPKLMAQLAWDMGALQAYEEAHALASQAAELAPGDVEIADILRYLGAHAVPKWHFSIVRDQIRNDAYDAALRRVVRPGNSVLEVGTGTGLLAMMAARAGAAAVYTCECNRLVAAHARKVIAQNGLSDRVHVLEKNSKDVTLEDIGGTPADVLVSEIVSYDLLQEHALSIMADVVPRLVRSGGAIIPYDGSVRVALVEDPEANKERMGSISGFDLSPFNALHQPNYKLAHEKTERLRLRSAPVDLFRFDFSGRKYTSQRAEVSLTATGGTVTGVVQWMRIGLDTASDYENVPGVSANSCWAAVVYTFPEPLDLAEGSRVTVHGRHDCFKVHIWAKPLN